MKFFKDICLHLNIEAQIPTPEQFGKYFNMVNLADTDFTKERFLPGTTGQRALYLKLLKDTGVPKSP